MNLKAFMQVASSQVSVAPTTALAALNIAANNMGLILNDLETDLESIKSKNNFTT